MLDSEDAVSVIPRVEQGHLESKTDESLAFEYMIKSLYYDSLARELGLQYSPHPTRVPFLMAFCAEPSTLPRFENVVFSKISEFAAQVQGAAAIEAVSVPPLLAYVIQNARDMSDILPFVLSLRESSACQQFRRQMSEINTLLTAGTGGVDAARYLAGMRQMLATLSKAMGLENAEIQSQLWLVQIPLNLPRHLYKSVFVGNRWHFNWLRDVSFATANMTSVAPQLRKFLETQSR